MISMDSVNLTSLSPIMASTLPSLEDLQSKDCFQQMLDTDSALQILSISRKHLELKMRARTVPREEPLSAAAMAEYVAITQSIAENEELVKTFEDLQADARNRHNLRARALLPGDKGIMNMPNEMLFAIFQNFRPPLDFSTISPYEGTDGADVETIKSIRLTCRLFRDNSSHLLIGRLRISPSVASLDRLESVLRHPEIWRRGERILDIDLRNYSATLAGDICAFTDMRSEDLCTNIFALKDGIESLRGQDDRDNLRRPGFLPEGVSISSAEDGVLQLERVMWKWDRFGDRDEASPGSVEGSAQRDPAILALQRGHNRYQQLYHEQQRLIQDGSFARAVAAAAAASGSKIGLYMSDMQWDPATHLLGTDLQELARSNFLSFTDPHYFDHAVSYIARPQSWWISGNDHPKEVPHSLLYEILLAMDMVETNLVKLEIRMNYPAHLLELSMSDEQLSCFKRVTKDLEAFIFAPITHHDDPLNHVDQLSGLYAYLRAAMGPQVVPNLYLDLYTGSEDLWNARPHLGGLISPSKWYGLRSAVLANFDVGIEGLRELIDMLEPGTKLGLDEPDLKTGTWAEALDCLRSKVSQDSWLINPFGAECNDMGNKEYTDIFIWKHQHREKPDGIGGSKATQYIRSVEGVKNPLLMRNTG